MLLRRWLAHVADRRDRSRRHQDQQGSHRSLSALEMNLVSHIAGQVPSDQRANAVLGVGILLVFPDRANDRIGPRVERTLPRSLSRHRPSHADKVKRRGVKSDVLGEQEIV
jgi:hypothetical protein